MEKIFLKGLSVLIAALPALTVAAGEYILKLPENITAEVEICPLKYGKRWAYSLEWIGNDAGALKTAKPLLDRHMFTDTPAGMKGGQTRPFRGTLAPQCSRIDAGAPGRLTLEEIRTLLSAGWGVANAGYWGSGIFWDETKKNDASMYRREIFWGQYFLEQQLFDGRRSALTASYPNSDPGYAQYLREYGLLLGTRRSTVPFNVVKDYRPWTIVGRQWLDEGIWRDQGKLDPLWNFPKQFREGDWMIDYTERLEGQREAYAARLDHIEKKYGTGGDNSIWAATEEEVARYAFLAKATKIEITPGSVKLSYPGHLNSSSLTLKIKGIPATEKWRPRDGEAFYRCGEEIYWTTPLLGTRENTARGPKIRRVYQGQAGAEGKISFERPIRFAALRILQRGTLGKAVKINLRMKRPNGELVNYLQGEQERIRPLHGSSGEWLLYALPPEERSMEIVGLEYTAEASFERVEVYGIED